MSRERPGTWAGGCTGDCGWRLRPTGAGGGTIPEMGETVKRTGAGRNPRRVWLSLLDRGKPFGPANWVVWKAGFP